MTTLQAASSPIASGAKKCLEHFGALVALPHQPDEQSGHDLSAEAVDCLGRFKIWAGNLGALQKFESKSSLDYRLRDASKISVQIVDLLDELAESIEDACMIVSNARENRTASFLEARAGDLDLNASDEDNLARNDSEEVSEIREIFESITDAINNLFRLSMIIRNNTGRDRYAKAAAAAQSVPFDDRPDISHVEHKFPALKSKGKEWLIARLGRAITQRRQYLRYCREHHDKISRSTEPEPRSQVVSSVVPKQQIVIGLSTDARSAFSKPTSTLAPTQASTLILTTDQIATEEPPEDYQSQTSYATSREDENSGTKLAVIKLGDVSGGVGHFECPYCWQIQASKTQKSWKKHVLSDLKPYVCTYEKCELKLFPDHNTWFSHELKDHRREWSCYLCSHAPFVSSTDYQSHLKHRHPQSFTEDQLSSLLEMSQRPVVKISPAECPFCDDWEKRLRDVNTHIPLSETLVVTPSQFKHHVGAHMEQLALFAIPRGYTEDGEADSGNAAPDLGSEGSSLAISVPDSTTAQDLRACEDVLAVMMNSDAYQELPESVGLRPMLQDIFHKLDCGQYTHASEFIQEVRQCFLSCRSELLSKDWGSVARLTDQFESFWSGTIMSVEEQWKRWRAKTIPIITEPGHHDGAYCSVAFRMADGSVYNPRFKTSACVDDLYAFVDCREFLGQNNNLPVVSKPQDYTHEYRFTLVKKGNKPVLSMTLDGLNMPGLSLTSLFDKDKMSPDEELRLTVVPFLRATAPTKDEKGKSKVITSIEAQSPRVSKLSMGPVTPKKVIRALYDYKAQSSQQLGFSRGDFFHVIGRENDTEWFEACNPALPNTRGLVPVSCFQVLGKTEKERQPQKLSQAAVDEENLEEPNLRLTLIAAESLHSDHFIRRFPNTFARVRIDGIQSLETSVYQRNGNPYWNESFDIRVAEDGQSTIAIEISNKKRFTEILERPDRGFLGRVVFKVGEFIDMASGGTQMFTRDLEASELYPNVAVKGTLSCNLTTDLRIPLIDRKPDYNQTLPPPPPHPPPRHVQDFDDELPQDWEIRIDGYGFAYYVDHNTKTTTWSKPGAPISGTYDSIQGLAVAPPPRYSLQDLGQRQRADPPNTAKYQQTRKLSSSSQYSLSFAAAEGADLNLEASMDKEPSEKPKGGLRNLVSKAISKVGANRGAKGRDEGAERREMLPAAPKIFEDEKLRIIDSCFSKMKDGSLVEIYATHIRVTEDVTHLLSPSSLNPSATTGTTKIRFILISVLRFGQARLHKARENSNGTFSIGKTWSIDNLVAIHSHGAEGSDTPAVGFTLFLNEPRYWQADSEEAKKNFLKSLVTIFVTYTRGTLPELMGFQPEDRDWALAILAAHRPGTIDPDYKPREQVQQGFEQPTDTSTYDIDLAVAGSSSRSHLYQDAVGGTCVLCEKPVVHGGVRTVPCTHTFHETCLKSWQLEGHKCPHCGMSVPPRLPTTTLISNVVNSTTKLTPSTLHDLPSVLGPSGSIAAVQKARDTGVCPICKLDYGKNAEVSLYGCGKHAAHIECGAASTLEICPECPPLVQGSDTPASLVTSMPRGASVDEGRQLVSSPTNHSDYGDKQNMPLIAGDRSSVLGECIVCRHHIHDLSRGTYFFRFSCGHETHEECWQTADKEDSLVCPICNSRVDNVTMDYIWHSMKDDETGQSTRPTPSQDVRKGREQPLDNEESEIENLNSAFADEAKLDSRAEDWICGVCGDNLEDGKYMHAVSCGHKFHSKCVEEGKSASRCPICAAAPDTPHTGTMDGDSAEHTLPVAIETALAASAGIKDGLPAKSAVSWASNMKSDQAKEYDLLIDRPVVDLLQACRRGASDIVKQRLKDTPEDVNAKDSELHTPLHLAVIKGYTDIVKLILQKGCNVNSVNKRGDTPLHDAIEEGQVDTVLLLLNAGANPLQFNSREEETLDQLTRLEKGGIFSEQDAAHIREAIIAAIYESKMDHLGIKRGQILATQLTEEEEVLVALQEVQDFERAEAERVSREAPAPSSEADELSSDDDPNGR